MAYQLVMVGTSLSVNTSARLTPGAGVDYNSRLHRGYEQGRGLSEAALRSWRTAMGADYRPNVASLSLN